MASDDIARRAEPIYWCGHRSAATSPAPIGGKVLGDPTSHTPLGVGVPGGQEEMGPRWRGVRSARHSHKRRHRDAAARLLEHVVRRFASEVPSWRCVTRRLACGSLRATRSTGSSPLDTRTRRPPGRGRIPLRPKGSGRGSRRAAAKLQKISVCECWLNCPFNSIYMSHSAVGSP